MVLVKMKQNKSSKVIPLRPHIYMRCKGNGENRTELLFTVSPKKDNVHCVF